MYIRVAAWNKTNEQRGKRETARDRLSFVMDEKRSHGSNVYEVFDNDPKYPKNYQKRRDDQKMRK